MDKFKFLKMNIANDLSKSIDRFNNSASGIKYLYKAKRPLNQKSNHREFYQRDEYSVDIELDEKPEIGRKYKNEKTFKPSTKQTVDQNEYKKLKKKYDFEEIEEKSEEELQKETKQKEKDSLKKSEERSETPPSRVTKNIYTEQYRPNKKIILDDEDEEEIKNINNEKNKKDDEEELDMDNNVSNESEKEEKDEEKEEEKEEEENKKKKNKNQKIKGQKEKKKNNKKKIIKKNKKEEEETEEEDEGQDENYKYKESKGIKSEGGDFIHNLKFKKRNITKGKKWNEEEYQKLISESKNYIPFKEYDINKFILTLSQMNNIKQNPELYKKYNSFLSLKKKQDKIQFDTLLKNILINFNSITKNKHIQTNFKVNALFKNLELDLSQFEFKSSEKTAYFDMFIFFISMYINDYKSFVESTSIVDTNKLLIPFHALAYIFSSQIFFCDMAKLMQHYYDKFLSYKIIPIYNKQNEEYITRINSRHIIWKQFEAPFLYYKNNKKLYIKQENGESKLDDKKVEEFADKASTNITEAYNNFAENIMERHRNINTFNINDERINLTDSSTSVPSSLYNQINGDILFKLKMNLYKYKMKQIKIGKLCKLNNAMIKKRDFNNSVKNKIFKQSIYYMSSCDIVQDFLDNYN